eukprot:g5123.t1
MSPSSVAGGSSSSKKGKKKKPPATSGVAVDELDDEAFESMLNEVTEKLDRLEAGKSKNKSPATSVPGGPTPPVRAGVTLPIPNEGAAQTASSSGPRRHHDHLGQEQTQQQEGEGPPPSNRCRDVLLALGEIRKEHEQSAALAEAEEKNAQRLALKEKSMQKVSQKKNPFETAETSFLQQYLSSQVSKNQKAYGEYDRKLTLLNEKIAFLDMVGPGGKWLSGK